MKKRLCFMLLSLCLLVLCFALPALAAENGTCGENVTWKLEDQTLIISGTGPMADYSAENPAPWSTIDEIYALEMSSGVTSIGEYAFYGMNLLLDVELPDTLTTIGQRAFYGCRNIQELQFHEGLISIGSYAFYGVKGITAIKIPCSVTSIGDCAFYSCSNLKTVDFGAGNINFGDSAFAYSGVVSPVIPEGVTRLSSNMFYYCSNINSIYLPASITEIATTAFRNASLHTVYYAGDKANWDKVSGNDIDSSYSTVDVYFNGSTTADKALGDSGLTYNLSKGVLIISGSGAMPNYTAASEQPWYSSRSAIKKVILETGITSVGDYAFSGLTALTEVELSERITSIGKYAFNGCSALSEIVIPERVTSIGANAFYNCNLEELVIPERVTTIGEYAFYSLDRLTYVQIPSRVTSLGASAFRSCSSLKTVVIPVSLKTIPDYAFYYCDALKQVYYTGTQSQWANVTIGSSNTALTKAAISYSWVSAVSSGTCGAGLSWEIDSNGLLQISGSGAMENYSAENPAPWKELSVKAVAVKGAETVGSYAFSGCEALEEVNLPASVTAIGKDAFSGCTALTQLNFAGSQEQWDAIAIEAGNEALEQDTLTLTILDNVIASGSKWSLYADGTLHLTGNVTRSTWSVWDTYIRYIVMDSAVTSTPDLSKLPNLERVEMSDAITSISSSYLKECPKLTTVKLPANLTRLDSYVFDGCTSLESIVIPDGVTTLSSYTFRNCSSLRSVKLGTGVTSIGSRAFDNCTSLERIDIPDTLQTIGDYAFNGCTSLKEIRLPYSVTSVGTYAFCGCSAMEKAVLSDGMAAISNYTFSDCTSLKQVEIPDSIGTIGNYAFRNCKALTAIDIPNSVTTIGYNAFENCGRLAGVEIPDSVTSMGTYAFSGCGNLQTVVIPDSLSVINNGAFKNCYNLRSVVLPDSIKTIGDFAFYQCIRMQQLEIPDSVTSIGECAFESCQYLKEVTIPASVQTIGMCAFRYCTGLDYAMIYRGVTTFGSSVFYDATNLKAVYYEGTKSQWEAISGYSNLAGSSSIKYALYYETVYENGMISGSCGTSVRWSFVPATGVLTISGKGACTDYTSSSPAPWSKFSGITAVEIQSGVTSVGAYAFYGNSTLKTVTIADTVKTIGGYAFRNCTALEDVVIPGTVTTVGAYAYCGCTGLKSLVIGEGVTTIGNDAFENTAITTVTVPDSVTSLGIYAFYNCSSLTEAKLGNGLTSVPNVLFSGCTSLRKVTLGAKVSSIGSSAFNNNISLCEVYYGGTRANWNKIDLSNHKYLAGAPVYCLGDLQDSGKLGETLTWEVSKDGSLTVMGEGAIPDFAAFSNTPWSVYADVITTVKIGRGITAVGTNAFGGFVNLAQTEYWGTEAQWADILIAEGNGRLKDHVLYAEAAELASGKLGTNGFTWKLSADGVLTISGTGSMPSHSYDSVYVDGSYWYVLNAPWRGSFDRIKHIVVEEGVTSLGSNAFSWTDARTVCLPSTLTSLGADSFRYCEYLTEITIPEKVTSIPSYCFYQCYSLQTVNLPDGVTSMADRAFGDCTSLETIRLPKKLRSLTNTAFDGCKALKYLHLPDALTTVNLSLGKNTSLKRIYIPASVTTVGNSIFTNSVALTDIYFGGTEEAWETMAVDTQGILVHYEVTATAGCNQSLVTCPVCGDATMDGAAVIAHAWDEGTVTLEPDCVTEGEMIFVCENKCSITRTEPVAALGHTEITDEALDVTCTENGLTEGMHCDTCGEVLIAQETISAPGHDMSAWETETAATCTEDGTERSGCSRCDYEQTQTITASGHNVVTDDAVNPNCTETGLTEGTHCSACGEVLTAQEIVPDLGHAMGDWVTVNDATCEEEGLQRSDCLRCDYYETDTIEAVGHSYEAYVTNPTCIDAGYTTMYCHCGDSYVTDYVQTIAHTEEEVDAVAATCTAQGTTAGVRCAVCNSTLSGLKPTAPTGHKLEHGICVVCGETAESDLAIITQPQSTEVEEGEIAMVYVEATGEDLTYVWYYKNAGSDEFVKASIHTNTYHLVMNSARNGREIYCVITDAYGNSVTTETVTLTMITDNVALSIISQPQSVEVAQGENAKVTVEAVGEDLSYQWYYKNAGSENFTKTNAFTGKTYQVTMSDARNGREIYCIITDAYGNSVTTETVTLTMITDNVALSIISQPQSVEVAQGENAKVTVEAVGEDLSYQWYYKNAGSENFTKTNAFTGKTYQVTMSDARNGREIYCVITDAYGNSVTTETVTLTMTNTDVQIVITAQPQSVEVAQGEIAMVTVEAEGEDLSYQWYYKNAGSENFTKTNAFTGKTYQVAMSDARNGREVYCVITDAYGNSVTTDTVRLTMMKADAQIVITTQPQSVEAAADETAEIFVEAVGEDLSYSWYYRDPADETFQKSSEHTGNRYQVTMNESCDGRQIYCVISDRYGYTVTTDTVTVTMRNVVTIVKQPESVAVAAGEQAKVNVEVEGDGLTFEWYYSDNGGEKFTKTTSFTGNSYYVKMSEARDGRQVYCVITDQYGNTAQTDTVTLTMIGGVKITRQPEDVSGAMGETVTVTVEAEGEGLTYEWYYKNKSASKFTKTSTFTGNIYTAEMSATRDGRQVYCVITDQYGNTVQTNTVTLTMLGGVKITRQPEDVSGDAGETVIITVEAEGEGLTYEWYYKNANASKFTKTSTFTGNTYSAEMTTARDGRQVYCVITDVHGNSVQTDTVTLSMNHELKIVEQPQDVTAENGVTVRTTVTASGAGLTYQWYIKNPGATKFSKSSVTGATYSCKMSNSTNGRQIYCVITDENGNSLHTDTVTLTMLCDLRIINQPIDVSGAEGETITVTVEAEGEGLTYEWYFKNASGSKFTKTTAFTDNTYTVEMNSSRNGRQIYCVVTDKYGNTVTSDVVTLSMK